jgi:bifunctional N-acetylglucosamine-1-phosphate-uridyltransferase/glucosamine-1-phosphate-acetyltransferase GlmU-like protein
MYENIPHIQPSPVTGEYYLTDLIKIAAQQAKKIVGFQIPFDEVGIGINKEEELSESQKLYLENH